jgi:hypothetical protein
MRIPDKTSVITELSFAIAQRVLVGPRNTAQRCMPTQPEPWLLQGGHNGRLVVDPRLPLAALETWTPRGAGASVAHRGAHDERQQAGQQRPSPLVALRVGRLLDR